MHKIAHIRNLQARRKEFRDYYSLDLSKYKSRFQIALANQITLNSCMPVDTL